MRLRTYISKHSTQTELAKKLGVTQGLIHQWLAGKTRITAERAIQIEGATEGQVTRYDLRPDIFGRSPQPTSETTEAAA